ncbi:TonB family protein [Rhizobium sophoriradicis]|uniref:TonB C-terminal domain-containing protein n=1 Tax=Rhizobium sophoriradicis TaxID=1535245 RepID=A0A2A5KQG2_9HYPH|nr:TonB family protein [Rhizobium sophoriradicis]PCK79207.1 hypothetical protein CPT34_19725 [Rhizobium sophoriradicis]
MAISAKTRSRQVLIGEADAGGSLNDNTPGMHPGHELPELLNAQRQPAGETVVHYTRFAQISSFPDHPESVPAATVPPPPMDAAVEKQEDEKAPVRRRVALTCVGSFFFHAGLAIALALFAPKPPTEVIEDAGEAVSVIVFGDYDIDQTSAGDPELELKPDEIATEEAKPDTVQPVEVESVDAMQPAQEVTRISPETVVAAEPEILVSQNPADTFVAQPMAAAVPEQPVPDIMPTTAPEQVAPAVQPTEVLPEEVKPVEAAEVSSKPGEKPELKPKLKVEKPKPDEKRQSRKKEEPTGGKNGSDRKDTTRGVATGQDAPESSGMSTGAGRGDGAGSAAVANYPGKVQKRIRRAIRVPSEYKRMGEAISVRLRLTIDGTGRLSSVSVAGSSGIPDLDKAALDGVRRAAPFPPFPPEWGKTSWSFTQEVQVTSQ